MNKAESFKKWMSERMGHSHQLKLALEAILEIEKERDDLQAYKDLSIELANRKGYDSLAGVFDGWEHHNLRQQAKGVQNLIKNHAETVQNYPWFADAPPTLEYLYDAGFGMDSKTAIHYAEGLLKQADELEQGE